MRPNHNLQPLAHPFTPSGGVTKRRARRAVGKTAFERDIEVRIHAHTPLHHVIASQMLDCPTPRGASATLTPFLWAEEPRSPLRLPCWLTFACLLSQLFKLRLARQAAVEAAAAGQAGRQMFPAVQTPSQVQRPLSQVQRLPSQVQRPPSQVQRPPSQVQRQPSQVQRQPSAAASSLPFQPVPVTWTCRTAPPAQQVPGTVRLPVGPRPAHGNGMLRIAMPGHIGGGGGGIGVSTGVGAIGYGAIGVGGALQAPSSSLRVAPMPAAEAGNSGLGLITDDFGPVESLTELLMLEELLLPHGGPEEPCRQPGPGSAGGMLRGL